MAVLLTIPPTIIQYPTPKSPTRVTFPFGVTLNDQNPDGTIVQTNLGSFAGSVYELNTQGLQGNFQAPPVLSLSLSVIFRSGGGTAWPILYIFAKDTGDCHILTPQVPMSEDAGNQMVTGTIPIITNAQSLFFAADFTNSASNIVTIAGNANTFKIEPYLYGAAQ